MNTYKLDNLSHRIYRDNHSVYCNEMQLECNHPSRIETDNDRRNKVEEVALVEKVVVLVEMDLLDGMVLLDVLARLKWIIRFAFTIVL